MQRPAHQPVRVNASDLLKLRPVASTPHFGLQRRRLEAVGQTGNETPVLLMSVPRRLLKRAIDRNTVRRIARESLRGVGAHTGSVALMLRLKRLPDRFDQLSLRARKLLWRTELEQLFSAGLVRA